MEWMLKCYRTTGNEPGTSFRRVTFPWKVFSCYKLTRAYVSIKNIVQAIGMLKYDKENGYGIENLTAKQERLIDGVSEYGSALAKDNEYPELAKQMDNKVGIDESIESFVKLPEPERTRESRSSRDWDIEL